MNVNFLNGTPKDASREYMYDFAQARYYDLMREANDYRYDLRVAKRTTSKTNPSPVTGLRGLMRMLLMALTQS